MYQRPPNGGHACGSAFFFLGRVVLVPAPEEVLDKDNGQRRQVEADALLHPVHGLVVLGFDLSAIGKPAAAVDHSVRREDLFINPRIRGANAILLAQDRQEIAHHHELVALFVKPAESDDALGVIVVGDPGEALPGEVHLPQRGMLQIEMVQVL